LLRQLHVTAHIVDVTHPRDLVTMANFALATGQILWIWAGDNIWPIPPPGVPFFVCVKFRRINQFSHLRLTWYNLPCDTDFLVGMATRGWTL